jgi:hypothetical protein
MSLIDLLFPQHGAVTANEAMQPDGPSGRRRSKTGAVDPFIVP